MGALAPQRFVGRCRWRAGTAIRIIDVVFHALVELFEEECALEAHLHDRTVETADPQASRVIVLFNVVNAAAELDAFPVVGRLHGWGEVFMRVCPASY